MKHEFKKINQGDVTRYVLESGDGGATVAGAVATVPMPMGSVRRRSPEESKETPKPRNFVAKNAKMGGAGQHRDKKKEMKQGVEKHRKPFAEGIPLGYSKDPEQAKWYHEGRKAYKYGTTAPSGLIQDIAKKHGCPAEWLKAFHAGYEDQEGWGRDDMAEGSDGGEEYNDEVGMADSNIHTIIRSAKELINTLEPMENMPEWAQDKLAQVKGMLVSVKDYIESQHEHGNIYHTDEDHSTASGGWGAESYAAYSNTNHGRGVMESLGDDFAQFMKDKGIKHRIQGSPEQEKQRTRDMIAQRGTPSAPAQSSTSSAYRDGFNDGMRGQRNLRASSIYGPMTNDYNNGYHAGAVKREKGQAESAPPGWKGTVKAMKKHKDIDNPFALAWSMKNKGYKSHKPNVGEDAYIESLLAKLDEQSKKS
jgi:hypothetical protein